MKEGFQGRGTDGDSRREEMVAERFMSGERQLLDLHVFIHMNCPLRI